MGIRTPELRGIAAEVGQIVDCATANALFADTLYLIPVEFYNDALFTRYDVDLTIAGGNITLDIAIYERVNRLGGAGVMARQVSIANGYKFDSHQSISYTPQTLTTIPLVPLNRLPRGSYFIGITFTGIGGSPTVTSNAGIVLAGTTGAFLILNAAGAPPSTLDGFAGASPPVYASTVSNYMPWAGLSNQGTAAL